MKRFTFATNVQVPGRAAQREHQGIDFPRGTDFSQISQSYLNSIALRLNQRPQRLLASKRQPINHEGSPTSRRRVRVPRAT